ncbi:hypothetical protein KCU91_g15069, partial [Aureobasidium melanogenum]
MATGIRFGTFPELSLECLESVERVITNFLCTWYHAFPAWRRPRYCTQILSDLQAHLEKFYEHEYHFNETQILLAAIKRWGQQEHSDAILDWLHAEFLPRVQEAARHHSTASRVVDRNEQKFYKLYTIATEHAAQIDVLEKKVSILLSNTSTPSVEAGVPARAEKEPEPSGGPGESSEASTVSIPTPTSTIRSSSPLQTPEQRWPTVILCVKGHNTNLKVKLVCDTSFGNLRWTIRSPDSDTIEFWHGNTRITDSDTPNSLGLEENSLINIVELLKNYTWEDAGDGVLVPWLAFDVFPQLQDSRDRFQTLETTIDMVSRRLSSFSQDLERELASEDPDARIGDHDNVQVQRLRAVLRQHTNAPVHDHDTDAPHSTSGTGGTSESLDMDDRYKALTERIKALEEKPFVMVEESAGTARSQPMQGAAQEPPSEFAALSDASTSSTCTPTPASTVVNEPVRKSSNTSRDRVSTATILELRVFVHFDDIVTVEPDGIEYYETPYPMIIRMHRNAPFKSLIDKLRGKFGDHELRQQNDPLKCIFDSDTPDSLNLEKDDELIFALINDRVETMDLTI